ncbi:uncharacterized protein LOC114828314 [Galendromus occidentalis]|uniref:Uncharacterized protein LOC114828314 n=1 Tax=Galendromus occidentalis TaxID=34638 RepID=A0AAJ7SFI4_9ACAR|nr:uncharacterized protein LOC114828314 [Galendromus occidentalis]
MNKVEHFGEVFGSSQNRSRNPLQVITNMFKRRNADPLDDEYVDELDCAGQPQRPLSANPFTRPQIYNGVRSPTLSLGNRLRPTSPLNIPSGRYRTTSAEDILSISPSLRNARSLQEDMELLRQSRQDNPYIQQQIEKFSVLSEGLSRFDGHSLHHQDHAMPDSPATVPDDHQQLLFSSSPKDEDILSITSQMDNRHEDLHQHLIRSPPPMFPQDVEQFVFEFSRTTSPQHILSSPSSIRTHRQHDSFGSSTPERGRLSRADGIHSQRSQDSSRGTPPQTSWPASIAVQSGVKPLAEMPPSENASAVPIMGAIKPAWKRCTSPLSKDPEPDQESLLVKSFDSAF